MTEILTRMNGGDLTAFLTVSVVVIATLVAGLGSAALTAWRRLREKEMAANIVHNLAERGVPAAEIMQVLEAAGLGAKQTNASRPSRRQQNALS